MTTTRLPHESWDGMLPGPPSRSNGGCADCSPAGLLAYGSGSSVAIVDTRSMQLVSAFPMPAPSPTTLAPFVTSVRWTPQPLGRDLLTHEPSNSHLRLAVGDRQGRLALLDFRAGHVALWFDLDGDRSKLGVQDLCWARADSWLLASLCGPSLLALWNASTGRCIWKYDATPEYFSCIRRDPFDSRHLCALGLRGFLLSIKILGDGGDEDIAIHEHQILAADYSSELQRIEREANAAASSPALAAFPTFFVKLAFSHHWRHIVFVTFPKELIVFDLEYGAGLYSTSLPRGCSKFMDVVADLDNHLIYCAHLDGKLTAWRRKE
ncbi:hypothetical protein ACLOJK_040308 [Asimina triloba]